MKRIALFVAIAFTTAASARAQIPDPGDPVCAHCEVDLKSQQPHKPGCPYYSEPANEKSTQESWTPNFNSIEYKYGNGVMCEQCGRTNGHDSDCLIGKTQRLIRDYWAKSKTPESNKFLIKTYEENIRLLAKQGREGRQAEKAQNKAEKKPRTEIPFECIICKATFKASGVDEASHIFANNPWFHKPTCPKYKPKPGQNPSTSLKDYTPAPERPIVSEPLMEMPVRQPAPQFSSINETSIRHEKPVSIIGKHKWGEISEESLSAFESLMGEEIPREFDIERYNHDKGTVILGTHKDNGRYQWTILCQRPNGSYELVSQQELKGGFFYGSQNVGELRDVHFEGQGAYIIAEYTSGYRQVYKNNGEIVRSGYNIKVLGSTVDGKRLLYVGKDEDNSLNLIIDEDGEVIADGHDIEQYDDAIIVRNGNNCYLSNWKGNLLEIGNINSFEEIKAYNNQGSYYILKDRDKGYAIIGRGFIRYGDWYDTEEEAHRIWKNYHQ